MLCRLPPLCIFPFWSCRRVEGGFRLPRGLTALTLGLHLGLALLPCLSFPIHSSARAERKFSLRLSLGSDVAPALLGWGEDFILFANRCCSRKKKQLDHQVKAPSLVMGLLPTMFFPCVSPSHLRAAQFFYASHARSVWAAGRAKPRGAGSVPASTSGAKSPARRLAPRPARARVPRPWGPLC